MNAPSTPRSAARKGVVVGTAGHVDHGKTALVRALTGVDTDRWKEEKERGLTIDLGFARLPGDHGPEVAIVDVPGHEDFLKNMLAGATGIDLLLLVVAADEGPMPQTSEHLAIARLLGVGSGIIAVTKADRADADWLALVRETALEELQRAFPGARWPVLAVSSRTGHGVDELRRTLRDAAAATGERPTADLFRLPVDRSFSVHGTGTVVTGTVWSGAVAEGDLVRVLPAGAEVRVRGLQVHGREREAVSAGHRCAAALVGLDAEEVARGSVLVKGRAWRGVRRLGVRVEALRGSGRPLEHGQRVRLYHGTREVMARLLLADAREGPLAPGEAGWALLRAEDDIVARAGDRFVLRFYSPVRTVGGGRVAELDPPRGWRRRAALWEKIVSGEPPRAVRAAVSLQGRTGVDAGELPLATGVPVSRLEKLLHDRPRNLLELQGRWFPAYLLEEARRLLLTELARMHREEPRASYASKEALRSRARRRFAPELVAAALDGLVSEGRLEAAGPRLRLPGHAPRLSAVETSAMEDVVRQLRAGALEPPTVSEMEAGIPIERPLLNDLLALLQEAGRVIPLSPELYVTADTARELVERARRVLERERPAPASAFKESFGVTRKYLIPILEHLDRSGITRRTPEGREPVR